MELKKSKEITLSTGQKHVVKTLGPLSLMKAASDINALARRVAVEMPDFKLGELTPQILLSFIGQFPDEIMKVLSVFSGLPIEALEADGDNALDISDITALIMAVLEVNRLSDFPAMIALLTPPNGKAQKTPSSRSPKTTSRV